MAKPTHAQPESATFDIVNRREEIERAEGFLVDALTRRSYPEAARFAVRLALEEALVNAFRHGHKALPADTPVHVAFAVQDDQVRLDIVDKGAGFDPASVPDPTLDENLEKPSGRGLLLMRAYMSSLEYLGNGNHLRMVFRRPLGG